MASKPKTAYGLLGAVCRAIESRPLNYAQNSWCATRGGLMSRHGDIAELDPALDVEANVCGTSFCRAGWIVAVHDGKRARPRSFYRRAAAILGMPLTRGCFHSDNSDLAALFEWDAVTGTPGTRSYVRRGVAGVRRFMKKYERHLRATKVHPK